MSQDHNNLKKKFPLISISIPVLNEADNLLELYTRLNSLSKEMNDRCNLEFIFSDNCSTDTTWTKLTELSSMDRRVKAIRFSKNFGFQRSILANYMHTSGDAVMQIDADLQDPPEMLKIFFDEWRSGYDVIFGIRIDRPENFLFKSFRKFGYWIINIFSEHNIPKNAGDFRLIDRKVLNALFKLKYHNPYLRGAIASLGFKQKGIEYKREVRSAGNSKFKVLDLFRLGLNAIFHHSTLPLRFASLFGLIVLFTSIIGAIYYFVIRILDPSLPEGLASIHILVLFGIGLHSLFMGIIGEYLLKIYLILRSDPVAVVNDYLNFEENEIQL